jgi:type I restriction-modification system DNA methylase subunit
MLNQHGKDFIKILEKLKPSKHAYETFSDWLVMTAATLYSWKKDECVENEYMEIAKQYSKEELDKHSELLLITINALEEKEQDFLGEVFTFAGLTNDKNGQFFTPYNISYMSAKMIIGENQFPSHRVCRINDPTCGAGGMLIAGAQVMKERNYNYQENALFIGQDIDARCARMAFIQLTLLAVPAVIYCMDTILMKEYWHRETISYHLAGMEFRLRAEELIDRVKNFEQAESKPEQIPIEIKISSSKALVQGELF